MLQSFEFSYKCPFQIDKTWGGGGEGCKKYIAPAFIENTLMNYIQDLNRLIHAHVDEILFVIV